MLLTKENYEQRGLSHETIQHALINFFDLIGQLTIIIVNKPF